MALTINVKRDAQSKREEVKRNGKTPVRWYCGCVVSGTPPGFKINPRYLVNCLDCGFRRDVNGTPVDG